LEPPQNAGRFTASSSAQMPVGLPLSPMRLFEVTIIKTRLFMLLSWWVVEKANSIDEFIEDKLAI
jgi:hypothetical protein